VEEQQPTVLLRHNERAALRDLQGRGASWMAFRPFRYHPNAEEGLEALFGRGKTTLEDLKRLIQQVQND
jgi:hypothetical protein